MLVVHVFGGKEMAIVGPKGAVLELSVGRGGVETCNSLRRSFNHRLTTTNLERASFYLDLRDIIGMIFSNSFVGTNSQTFQSYAKK